MDPKSFVSGHDFRVYVRTYFSFGQWSEKLENRAPEARNSLAQRFSAGCGRKMNPSPVGTTGFLSCLRQSVVIGRLPSAKAPG
jgi:hypothetical protein